MRGINSTKMKKDAEIKTKAKKLFTYIAEGSLSEQLYERVRDWFFSIPEDGIAQEALAEWATENVKPKSSMPDKRERELFAKLAEMLGIETSGRRSARTIFWARAAAVFIPIFMVLGGALLYLNQNSGAEVETLTLYAGDSDAGHEIFTLPDGSEVILKYGSTLEYRSDFMADRRVVIDGEAFFDVVHDAASPFTVDNEAFRVRVLGTEFGVEAYRNNSQATVILVSGSVRVEREECSNELVPGQKMVIDRSTSQIVEIGEAGPGEIMRITGGDLTIDNMRAMEALAIMADYFEKELVVDEGVRADSRLNVILPHDISIEAAIVSLSKLSKDVKCEMVGDVIYVSKK